MKARISQICRRSLVVVLCPLLLLQPLFARQTSTQSGIRIVVVRGDRARNVIQQIPAEPLTVRVEDLNRQPIAGVTVIFTAPATGPSGDFATGSTIANVIANQDGLAIAEGYHPNGILGGYLIQLRAQYRGEVASLAVEQTNIEAGKSHAKLIITLLSIAAAGGAIALARRNPGDSTPTLTLGDSAVGAPRR